MQSYCESPQFIAISAIVSFPSCPLEQLAKANGLTGKLDVAHFAGVELAHDWQSRTAKTVRARAVA